MTTPDTICFGTLFKTGGKGHTVKNQKLRWCVLQGTFLTYYFEKPDLSGKAFDKLKGQLYLEGCQIRDADPTTERENSFVITNSSGKEYIFTPPIDKEECTMWKNAIFYALKKVKIFADNLSGEPLAAGWLMKKGGKGHKTQNWKKRYFVLQGQFLNYFDRANARTDDLTGLKGWINLTEITELSNDEDAEDGCEKPHYLKIITTNEKGYFLVARNDEEKKQWFFRLKRQLDLFVKTYELPQTNLVIEEKEVRSGFLLRLSGSEWRKTWVVLTNLNIRFYKGDTRKNPTDLGKQLFETIRLVGISLEESKVKGKDNIVKLVDVLGNTYTLSIVEAEFKMWVDSIKKTASTLVTTIINKGESININCRTSPEDTNDKTKRQEYTQVKLTRDTLSFFFLLSNARVDILLKNIDKISDVGGVFNLKYQLDGKAQELRVKSSNVQGLYSTINTVLEIYREKNKPITEPTRPSEQEEFSFENTYLSDSFFEKMERDVEAEASAAANAAVESVGEAAVEVTVDTINKQPNEPAPQTPVETPKQVEPTKVVDVPKPVEPPKQLTELSKSTELQTPQQTAQKPVEPAPQPKPVDSPPQPRPTFVQALPKYMKADQPKKPNTPPRGWVTGRMPVEEKLLLPSLKDTPIESSPPQPIVQDILSIPTIVTPVAASPEELEQHAQELLLVKTHPKSSEHLSLANEMDIDISNLRDSFMNDPLKGTEGQQTNPNPIRKAGSDYSFDYNDGDSAVYGISDRDLHEIVEASEDDTGMFIKTRLSVYKPNPASLEPTLTDLSDSACSSMTNSLVFKADEEISFGTSSLTSTYESNHVTNSTQPTTVGSIERLVVIKSVTLPNNNTSPMQLSSSPQTPPVERSDNRRDSVVSGTSTRTSSRRHSLDYENFYSSITYETLTPVGSATNDALEHVDKAQLGSKSSLEAQIALQSIEQFLNTAPVIDSVPADTVITPRAFYVEEPKQIEEPKQDPNLYASIDNLLKETEDLLRQTLRE